MEGPPRAEGRKTSGLPRSHAVMRQRYSIKPDPTPITSEEFNELSLAQRNSFLGQEYFENELEAMHRYEREISLELHRHGGDGISISQSNLMVYNGSALMIDNGGLQSSSSAPISNSTTTSNQAASTFPYNDSEHSSFHMENGTLQESSSRTDLRQYISEDGSFLHLDEHHNSSTSGNWATYIDQGSSSNQAAEPSTGKAKRRARAFREQEEIWGPGGMTDYIYIDRQEEMKASETVDNILEAVWPQTSEEASRLETDPEWENIGHFTEEDTRRVHYLEDGTIQEISDESDTTSLATFDSTTGQRKYPTTILVDLPRRSSNEPHRTNGIADEELARHSRMSVRRSQRQRSRMNLSDRPNPFIKTPPEIVACEASSSSLPPHPSSSSRRTHSDRRKQYSSKLYDPRRSPGQPRQAHRRWTRLVTPDRSASVSSSRRQAHAQHMRCATRRSHRAKSGKGGFAWNPNLPYKLDDISFKAKLSPVPKKVWGPYPKDFIVTSPQAPKSRGKWYYTRQERSSQRYKQRRAPSPQQYPYPTAHIVTKEEHQEQRAAEERRSKSPVKHRLSHAEETTLQGKYSLAVLFSCSLTLFLLPFFATGKLDWAIRDATQGLIWGYTVEHKRMAWLIFLGELVAIFAVTVTVVIVLKLKTSS